MAAVAPLAFPASAPDAIASELARRNPELAADVGVTADTFAALAATKATLAEAEGLGWISAEERRLYEGEATLEDLLAQGFGEDEARALLDEQRQDLSVRVIQLSSSFQRTRAVYARLGSREDLALRAAIRRLTSERFPIPSPGDREAFRTPAGACWIREIAGTSLVLHYTFDPPVIWLLAVGEGRDKPSR